jgi:putative ABC transport system permease protein
VKLLRAASARYLLQHRAQLLLSILGVTVGVAAVLAIDLAIESAKTGFRISAETVSGKATHALVSDVGTLDDELLSRIRITHRISASAPMLEGFATSSLLPGEALRILGVDPFSETPFRSYVARETLGSEIARLVTTRRAVVLSAGTAQAARVSVGDTLPVMVGGEAWGLPVVGVTDGGDGVASAGLSGVLLMDVSGAQEVLREIGRLTRIDLRIPDTGEGVEALRELREQVPPGVRVEAVGTRTETMSGMIAAFDVNLTALSLLALIFGVFLIYNAVSFSVVQRGALIGRLRAIGVTREEIVRMILVEALWVGSAGTLLGVVLGVALARGLVRMVARTINDLYFAVSVQGVSIDSSLLVKAIVMGLGATMLAALPPALEAARLRPTVVMLRSALEERSRLAVRRFAIGGAGLASLGGLLLLIPTRSLGISFGALSFIICGLAFMTPAATLVLLAALRPVFGRVWKSIGLMACRGVGDSLSRTAPAIAALVVAVSVTVGLGVMIDSFRGTLVQWLDGTLQADVYVSLPGVGASRASGTLWPEVIDEYSKHPAVVGVSTYRGIDVVSESDDFHLVALNLSPLGERAFSFQRGNAAAIMEAFQLGRGALVSEPFAYHRGLTVGDQVTMRSNQGDVSFEILGVFFDYGSERGTVMIDRALYDTVYSDSGVTSMGLFLQEGADSEAVVRDLLALVPEGRSVVARTNDRLREASLEVFDRTFRVTTVLRLLAFIVAFVGVLSALMALELERAREIGVLRATGMTPGEVRQLIVTQTGAMGLVAGLLAIPMGLVLSLVMIFVINKRSFGWSLNMQIDADVLWQAVALSVVASLLAGLYPAWRMARTSPALALRGE